jgi:hypothetical protein
MSKRKTPPVYEAPQSLIEAIDSVVSDAISKSTTADDEETFTLCRLCGEWEGHTDDCPIPWMDSWLSNHDEDNAHTPGNVRDVKRMLKLIHAPKKKWMRHRKGS